MTTSTPEPTPAAPATEPTAATVVADVHQVLDTAKTDAQTAVDGIEHAGFGHLVDDAKALVERAFDGLKQELHDLVHGSAPAEQPTPPAGG